MQRLILLLALCAGTAWADGIIIPEFPFQNLAIKYHRVEVEIEDQTAYTEIDQVFLNREPRDIEGTYIFPLPKDASFSAFSMHVDGEPLTAEILEADEAREIYEEIVRQRIDPALLEYVGQGAYRARIFPIPAEGEKRVQLAYDELLTMDADIVRYLYPLNTEKFSSEPLEDVSVTVTIRSQMPIKAIYSPSHEIVIERNGENEAKVVYADEGVTPDKDFVLYYTVAREEVGVSLLTFWSDEETKGYYMLLAAPQVEPEEEQVIPKRMIFALDRSGSMAGEKMDQAREALRFAVRSLNEGDEVNIVDYGTSVEQYADAAVGVTAENRSSLLSYIDDLEASGGTNIHGALLTSLGMLKGDDRAEMVVFLTDGKPTIGERDVEKILADVESANEADSRLFVFGVGNEVNTHLLDRLSGLNGGASTYVKPGEDIEVAVSSFYAKVSNPVLEDLELEFVGGKRSDYYPPELPDLFRGSQIMQLGRLEGEDQLTVRLTGQVQGREELFEREVELGDSGPEFLPRLWATRKVGFLLDQIRLHGEEAELVDEIVALSKRYGIITPYTSFLIVEDEMPVPTLADDSFKADSGAGAVAASEEVRGYAEADNTAGVQSEEVRYVGEKTFFLRDGYWQDSQYEEGKPVEEYTFGSKAYFQLVGRKPELGRYLSLGKQLILNDGGENIRISEFGTAVEEGQSSTTPRDIRLEQNFPNPFNSGTEIRFSLSAEDRVELNIFDQAGQQVATLIDRTLRAGSHVATWDGRGAEGKELATGVYMYQLRVAGFLEGRKLVLLR
jgi:Ca-activated chloride channel homolog